MKRCSAILAVNLLLNSMICDLALRLVTSNKMYYSLLIKKNIMKKSIVTILIIVISLSAFSQDDCNCEQALNLLIKKMESEYPGFKEKTPDKRIYNTFKERLIIKSQNISATDGFDLLSEYLSFFRDAHIFLIGAKEFQEMKDARENQDSQTNEIQDSQTNENSESKVDSTLDDFYKYISESEDEFEGVWSTSAYKVGIIKKENEYHINLCLGLGCNDCFIFC